MIRIQLELAQVKADIDRRIHEKEEEFEATRYGAEAWEADFRQHDGVESRNSGLCHPLVM